MATKLNDRHCFAARTSENFDCSWRESLSGIQKHFGGPPGNKNIRPKKDISDDICRTLVGFANADGGELLVGVEDDGVVTGLGSMPSTIIEYLEKCWKDGVHKETPLNNVKVSQIEIDGNKILYFLVPKSADVIHLTADGRCLQRKDLATVPAPFEEISFSRQEQHSRAYDRQYVNGATMDDLDIPAVKILAEHVSSGMTAEKCLQYLGMAEFSPAGLQLTRAALLLFSKEVWKWHPRSHVRILKVDGNEVKTGSSYNVINDTPIQGNILYLIVETWNSLRPSLTQTKLSQSGRFEASVIYPEAACREALINAIAHRDYSQEGRGIEIFIFDDRIEFKSPGGLLSSLSVNDLMQLQGAHQSRNALIARALREIGYMREVGEGIRRMFELMQDSELEAPQIKADNIVFTVILRNTLMYSREHILWLENFSDFKLSKDEKSVIVLGYGDRHLSANDIISAVGIIDIEEFRKIVDSLKKKSILQQTMSRDAAYALAKKKKISRRDVQRWRVGVPGISSGDNVPKKKNSNNNNQEKFTKDLAAYRVFVGNIPRDMENSVFESFVSSILNNWILEWPEIYSAIGPKYCVIYTRGKRDAEILQKAAAVREFEGMKLIARTADMNK